MPEFKLTFDKSLDDIVNDIYQVRNRPVRRFVKPAEAIRAMKQQEVIDNINESIQRAKIEQRDIW